MSTYDHTLCMVEYLIRRNAHKVLLKCFARQPKFTFKAVWALSRMSFFINTQCVFIPREHQYVVSVKRTLCLYCLSRHS